MFAGDRQDSGGGVALGRYYERPAAVPHNLVKPLISLRVAFHGLLMLLFDLLCIFRRSVPLMPGSGKLAPKHLFRSRCMINFILKESHVRPFRGLASPIPVVPHTSPQSKS